MILTAWSTFIPINYLFTPYPTSTTSPEAYAPIINGGVIIPDIINPYKGFTDAMIVLTKTSPAFGFGI